MDVADVASYKALQNIFLRLNMFESLVDLISGLQRVLNALHLMLLAVSFGSKAAQ